MSHARGFLNEVATDILVMEDKQIQRYKGNFNTYEQRRLVFAAGDSGEHVGLTGHNTITTAILRSGARRFEEGQREERERENSEKKREKLQKFIDKNIGGGAKVCAVGWRLRAPAAQQFNPPTPLLPV